MKKKILIAALLVTLPVAFLPGCGQSPQPSPSPTVKQTEPTVTSNPAQSPVPPPAVSSSPPGEISSGVVQSGIPLKVTEPVDTATLTGNSVTVKGQTKPGATVSVNEEADVADGNGNFSVTVSLDDGPEAIDVIATDDKGNEGEVLLMVNVVPSQSPSASQTGTQATIPLKVTGPADGADVRGSSVTVKGQTEPGATVSINDQADIADSNGNFNIVVDLDNGHNALDVIAIDDAGNEAEVILLVNAVTGG